MPSWTELRTAAVDLRAIVVFRSAALTDRQRRRLRAVAVGVLLLTGCVVGLAGWWPQRERAGSVLALVPSGMIGFLVLAVVAAVASAGGREVVPRDQAVAFPVSTTTEHLGALLLAPLNIGWLLQSWLLLGATMYALGPIGLWSLPAMFAWILGATVAGQGVGWLLEGMRRTRYGVALIRALLAGTTAAVVVLVATDGLTPLLDRAPTLRLLLASVAPSGGRWVGWAGAVAGLLLLAVALAWLGAGAASWALGRPERAELRLESGRRAPRSQPRTALGACLGIDRAGIWRSVPFRRGIAVVALVPGAVALAGGLEWRMLTVFPGLVVSGGALLFGVNVWCLDGRGALWRESLPVAPRIAFWSRTIALTEVLLGAAVVTALTGTLRAGRPTGGEVAALVCATLVVTVQVAATSMRWSVRSPFAADLRSARATPAPPMTMVGYSARLACWTTLTGLVFSVTALQSDWRPPVLFAVPMLCWSLSRLIAAASAWEQPVARARVLATVAG